MRSVEEKINKKHILNLIEREKLVLSGVKEVFSFDEQLIELETSKGYLDIRGEDLHVVKMSIEEGDLAIEGQVNEISYHDTPRSRTKKGSMLSKLLK